MSLILSYFYYSLEEKSCISKSFLGQVYFMQGNNVLFLFGVCFFFFFLKELKYMRNIGLGLVC